MALNNRPVKHDFQLSPDGQEYQDVRSRAHNCCAVFKRSIGRIVQQARLCDKLYLALLADKSNIDNWGALNAATAELRRMVEGAPWN